jgi:GDSL-like Lipase/Acylhydrolase family
MTSKCGVRLATLAVVAALVGCGKSGATPSSPAQPQGGAKSGTAGSAVGGSSGGAMTGGTASGAAAAASASAGMSNGGGATSGGTTSAGGAVSAGGAGGGPWMFPAGVTKPKIMIVGDSISAGPGCYKKALLQDLTDNHYSNFEFVGQYTDDCGGGVRHSAVSCSTAAQFTMPMFTMPNCAQGTSFPGMSTLVVTHTPDLIMMQLGVNDVWGGAMTEVTLGNYATLIQQARAQNPNVVLVVAQIQKIRPNCDMVDDSITKRAEMLVNAVPAWAAQQSMPKSPVFVADLWTNSDWSMAETIDCVHPNDVGAVRMGMNWYNALKGILKRD